MRRPSRRVVVITLALIATSVALLGLAGIYGFRPMRPGIQRSARGLDVNEARQSTAKVRTDLEALRSQVSRANWSAADARLRAMRSDWKALVRDTHLTNRHFVDGMDALQKSIRYHNRKASVETVRLMTSLIRLLEAVFR